MIKLPSDQLKNIAQTQLCGICREPLNVVWNAQGNCETLQCFKGHFPDLLVRNPSITEEFKQGKVGQDVATRRAKEFAKALPAPGTPVPADHPLGLLPVTDLETGELLDPNIIRALIDYAHRYELDPYRGHVVIMHGKPYIGLDGYIYHADQTGVPYSLKSRPLTEDERKTYQIPEGAHAWTAEVIKKISDTSFTGMGIVTQAEMTEMSKKHPDRLRSPVVAKHPWQLSQKRAEWQAMRRAFPIGSPDEEKAEAKVEEVHHD
jgi:hypothetical protein